MHTLRLSEWGCFLRAVTSVRVRNRACAWRGARLPHSFEWQYAAQGPDNDGRKYPWGNDTDPSLYPTPTTDGGVRPAPVGAHSPLGDSPFGVRDLVGNVWQWTATEFVDAHTRSVIVRGSSSYVPLTKYAARVIERAPLPR